MIFFNPFEQFEVIPLIKISSTGFFDFSITNLTVAIVSLTFILWMINYVLDKSYGYIPNNWQIIMEGTYKFIYSILFEQANRKGIKYFPHLLTIFFFILFFNLSGLTPFSFTASSHVIITFGLALSYFLAWVIVAVKELGLKFLYIFCPRNMLYGCYHYW